VKLLGIDTGGTFTDFVYFDGGGVRIHKVPSTPDAPERAILEGINEMGIALADLRVTHGSTVATNAILEGKVARTAYIANRGLGDVLSIGRQARRELYNLQPKRLPPPVPEELCLETGGRLSARGEVIEPLTKEDLAALVGQIKALKPRAVAINLLFSFLDARFEREIEAALPPDIFVSRSSEVLPEHREYERGITTWLNACVGPLVDGYLARLGERLRPGRLSVMRSSGNTCDAARAGREAVHLLLSGPAGGLSGARYIGASIGLSRLLTFDMGGTSTDVALIDGDIGLTGQGRIGPWPVGVPMVDIHSIGAGGGSIATVDEGAALQVGPESAGAVPGPACYGQGGTRPTVTDANLVLGHLPESALLGGRMPLDRDRACTALSSLVGPLVLGSIEEVAAGIVRVANEHMAQALRVISVERGIDPREFVLVAFGGAGGMHVCALAEALGMRRALAPVQAGVLSALGMLVAPPGRQLSRTVGCVLTDCTEGDVTGALEELADRGREALAAEGIPVADLKFTPSLDLCYRGQSFTLNLPWEGLAAAEAAFHRQHESQYGHRLDLPVELINVRLGVFADPPRFRLQDLDAAEREPATSSRVYGIATPVPVWPRGALAVDEDNDGPLIVTDSTATIYVPPGWRCRRDPLGNLLLDREASG